MFFHEKKGACGKPVTRIIGWGSHKVWFGPIKYGFVSFWVSDIGLVGLVWFGVVWFDGVVWCGVVWCGMACGVVWYGVVWCGMVWYGVVWCGW